MSPEYNKMAFVKKLATPSLPKDVNCELLHIL